MKRRVLVLCLSAAQLWAARNLAASGNVGNFGSGSSLDNKHAVTYLAWIRPTDTTINSWIWDKSDAGFARERFFLAEVAGGTNINLRVKFNCSTTNALAEDSTNLTSGTWYHVASSWNGGTSAPKLYRGTLTTATAEVGYSIGPTACAGTIDDDNLESLRVGNIVSEGVNYFHGDIANVLMFPRQLTVAEIDQLRLVPSCYLAGGNCNLYSNFSNAGSSQPDWSGNANTGTWTGTTVVAHPAISISVPGVLSNILARIDRALRPWVYA